MLGQPQKSRSFIGTNLKKSEGPILSLILIIIIISGLRIQNVINNLFLDVAQTEILNDVLAMFLLQMKASVSNIREDSGRNGEKILENS